MPELSVSTAPSLLSQFSMLQPAISIRTFIRTAGYTLRPPRPVPFSPTVRRATDAVLDSGRASLRQKSSILFEQRKGDLPTIVLGGFVPAATEQVYLLRGRLLKFGSLYYFNYNNKGFSLDLFCAQFDDLIEELTAAHGQRPVIFTVSFGCGLLLEWLRRCRRDNRKLPLGGFVFISPIACIEDLLDPSAPKPTTLLGRAVKPFLDVNVAPAGIEKARAIFTKMFEIGAQNKEALSALMTKSELERLRENVLSMIKAIDSAGACERVNAMRAMPPPGGYFNPEILPLSDLPTLILYAEKEASVISEKSPTRFAFENANHAYFPNSTVQLIENPRGSQVQHASLIFHVFNFLPPIRHFYRRLRKGRSRDIH